MRQLELPSRQPATQRWRGDPARIEHRLDTLIAQRVLGLALGYEDINDHDRLRADSAMEELAAIVARDSPTPARYQDPGAR